MVVDYLKFKTNEEKSEIQRDTLSSNI